MKKLLFFLTMLVGALTAFAGEPRAEFTEVSHDFGTIKEDGGPVTHEFEFKNTGDAPLLIMYASASCGCTRPDYPKKPIEAGKKGVIKVTFLPENRPGEFNKTITVRTNSTKTKKVTLRIKGYVNPSGKP
jgi:hypothetical protein